MNQLQVYMYDTDKKIQIVIFTSQTCWSHEQTLAVSAQARKSLLTGVLTQSNTSFCCESAQGNF